MRITWVHLVSIADISHSAPAAVNCCMTSRRGAYDGNSAADRVFPGHTDYPMHRFLWPAADLSGPGTN
jgi:hypothetical protein